MTAYTHVASSDQCNTYGGLSLVKDPDGAYFLQMEDCFGPDYTGPLTAEQVAAFHVLFETKGESK